MDSSPRAVPPRGLAGWGSCTWQGRQRRLAWWSRTGSPSCSSCCGGTAWSPGRQHASRPALKIRLVVRVFYCRKNFFVMLPFTRDDSGLLLHWVAAPCKHLLICFTHWHLRVCAEINQNLLFREVCTKLWMDKCVLRRPNWYVQQMLWRWIKLRFKEKYFKICRWYLYCPVVC